MKLASGMITCGCVREPFFVSCTAIEIPNSAAITCNLPNSNTAVSQNQNPNVHVFMIIFMNLYAKVQSTQKLAELERRYFSARSRDLLLVPTEIRKSLSSLRMMHGNFEYGRLISALSLQEKTDGAENRTSRKRSKYGAENRRSRKRTRKVALSPLRWIGNVLRSLPKNSQKQESVFTCSATSPGIFS